MSGQKENVMNEHTNELHNIKMWMYQGAITYDRAKEMAEPHIAALNEKAKEIAKKYGVKPRQVTFAAFMR
jgi:DNA anti-recombination protein RmuC